MKVYGIRTSNGQELICSGIKVADEFVAEHQTVFFEGELVELEGVAMVMTQQTSNGISVGVMPMSMMIKHNPAAPWTMFHDCLIPKSSITMLLKEEQLNSDLVKHYMALKTGIAVSPGGNSIS